MDDGRGTHGCDDNGKHSNDAGQDEDIKVSFVKGIGAEHENDCGRSGDRIRVQQKQKLEQTGYNELGEGIDAANEWCKAVTSKKIRLIYGIAMSLFIHTPINGCKEPCMTRRTSTYLDRPRWIEQRHENGHVRDEGDIAIQEVEDGGHVELATPDVSNFVGQCENPVVIQERWRLLVVQMRARRYEGDRATHLSQPKHSTSTRV